MVQVLADRQKILLDVWGTVSAWPKCPICRTAYTFIQYDCPSRDDVLHAIIADEIKCDILLSFDGDFGIIGTLPRFAHMPIQVI
jgi:hypothetical protein